MSGYHLCQVKKARHPYFIESISTNIFTIEELCFYLEKNIYLLDQTIINEKLLDWIGTSWVSSVFTGSFMSSWKTRRRSEILFCRFSRRLLSLPR